MADFPTFPILPRTPNIHVMSPESELAVALMSTTFTSTAVTANQPRYAAFKIWEPKRVRQMFIHNGTAVSGNLDLGIYDYGLRRIVSTGSTAQSGTSALQFIDITDTVLPPGLYYWGYALDNGTGQVFRATPSSLVGRACGWGLESSVYPLPSTANPPGAATYFALMGMTTGKV